MHVFAQALVKRGRLLAGLLMVLALMPLATAQPVAAATNSITLKVIAARTANGITQGTPVTTYKWILNQDNTGDPRQARNDGCSSSNAGYPDSCRWPSIQAMNGYAPIMAQGDQNSLNQNIGIDNLPAGKYLISVLADSYKIDGQSFTIPQPNSMVTVSAQQLPLPTATLRAKVFEDNASANGQPDIPAEHGLQGFRATITDSLGEVTTDVYGNPLCTQYTNNDPAQPIPGSGGNCLSDANGDVMIPNMGPNRYAMSVTPPNGQQWIQTTTLEGNHDWDTWVQEGATGYDTEFSIAGEPFPSTIFGFVKPKANPFTNPAVTGSIRGQVWGVKVYVPPVGGLPFNGGTGGGLNGVKEDKTIGDAWIALSDLNNGDQTVLTVRADANGNFNLTNIPNGDYSLTYWDETQSYILDLLNVSVRNGQATDLGHLHLAGWFTTVTGKICNDINLNGKCDASEPGISGFPVTVKRRTNSVLDRGSQTVVTDASGNYALDNMYPLTAWLIIEAYSDRFYTTGATYQADNQPNETTISGAGVDVNILPVIGLSGRLDWAVRPYNPFAPGSPRNPNSEPQNGGIVGTVSYDTTRNELDARYAVVENWQPGIPDLNVDLFSTVRCTPAAGDATCVRSPNGGGSYYKLEADGSLTKGQLLNRYVTETWARPKNCTVRNLDQSLLSTPLLPTAPNADCLEAPLMSVQFGSEYATVDGNYAFGDGCLTPNVAYNTSTQKCADGNDPVTLPAGDYIVKVNIPNDKLNRAPMYNVTREEDINIFKGDSYVPQVPPSACAGALHTVDVKGVGADGPTATNNPEFAANGGSPYEGMQKPLCDAKFVTVANGRSVAPSFNLFTNVPVPGRFSGLIVDDLNLSTNPLDTLFGEKAGVANSPVGIYDFANRLVTTVNSDPNGIYDVLLPSTNTISCPSPTGVCTNLYRMVGNDPGIPGRLNRNYNPAFRTIAATFELFPGDLIPADLAPTQIGVTIEVPGSQFNAPAQCALAGDQPQVFAINRPFHRLNPTNQLPNPTSYTLTGLGFGASRGNGQVLIGGLPATISSWNDRSINFTVPTLPSGPQQLTVVGNSGLKSVNSLTFHIIGAGYNPQVLSVDSTKPVVTNGQNQNYAKIQDAIDAAASNRNNNLVVVYPGGVPDSSNPAYNPQKAYFENLIISSPVKLQGVGPGGVYPDNSVVEGSVIDGAAFGGDTALADAWRTKIAGINYLGDQNIGQGAVVTLVSPQTFTFQNANFKTAIDGFGIQGGNQQGFPNNINQIGGGRIPGQQPVVEVQGGAIYANAYIQNLQVTNNQIQSNGGAYGAIRIGTPDLPGALNNNRNDNLRVVNNRITANGGSNLAGALGIFAGTPNYEVAQNDFCGNFSAEYGGAISHYGFSPNGTIHDNRIYFNRSYDEGGGIMIAGQLSANPATLSPGAGPVDIYNNQIQSNLGNDDGGGIRFLMAGNFAFNVYNNLIVNNISTHEGGGIALDDAPNVRVFNNTIMKNMTTATAATSNGSPAPAGLSTGANSVQLQATLPLGAATFSKPLLFNNIFSDNRAGTYTSNIGGIGLAGDPAPINYWDIGSGDGQLLEPTNSILATNQGFLASATNKISSAANFPQVQALYDTSVAAFPWRTNTTFRNIQIVAVDLPPTLMGNYHLAGSGSPAANAGASIKSSIPAPASDIDGEYRPSNGGYEIGADELPGPLPILDAFNRADAANLGAAWNTQGGFGIVGNTLRYNSTNDGLALWKTGFGAGSQQAFVTFSPGWSGNSVYGQTALILKANRLAPSGEAPQDASSYIEVLYRDGARAVDVRTRVQGQGLVARATFNGVQFNVGDTLTARTYGDGTVAVYKNGIAIGTVNVTQPTVATNRTYPGWPSALAAGGGQIGIWMRNIDAGSSARFDNFGGGVLP